MIVNSTFIIALGNINRLDLLSQFSLLIPERVLEEITKEPAKGDTEG